MNRHVENLLSQIKCSLAHLKQSGRHDLQGANDDFGAVEELKRLALQLVQINTNSLPRAIREHIRSTLVEAAAFMLQPEEIEIIQKEEGQRIKLIQKLAGASTRAGRREPTQTLRQIEEQQMLF